LGRVKLCKPCFVYAPFTVKENEAKGKTRSGLQKATPVTTK
jgi:hypothetical protein